MIFFTIYWYPLYIDGVHDSIAGRWKYFNWIFQFDQYLVVCITSATIMLNSHNWTKRLAWDGIDQVSVILFFCFLFPSLQSASTRMCYHSYLWLVAVIAIQLLHFIIIIVLFISSSYFFLFWKKWTLFTGFCCVSKNQFIIQIKSHPKLASPIQKDHHQNV